MVRRAVDAFVNGDAALARAVIQRRRPGGRPLRRRSSVSCCGSCWPIPCCIERASHLIIVIKNWERIADQATNIAEEVLFILEGGNVKHPYLQGEGPEPGIAR